MIKFKDLQEIYEEDAKNILKASDDKIKHLK